MRVFYIQVYILFDNREPLNNQTFFSSLLGPQLSRLQSFPTWSAAGGVTSVHITGHLHLKN